MKTSSHIIEKVVVEVNTTQVNTANYIKNNLDVFLKNELFPKLEELLHKYDKPDAVVRFHELNIDLNVKDWKNSKRIKFDILFEFEGHLQKQLTGDGKLKVAADVVSSEEGGRLENLSINKNEEEIFLFFLENGFLPWYGNEQQIFAFQEKKNWQRSFVKTRFLQKLKGLLQKDEITFLRFFYQFPVEMVTAFISKINVRLEGVEKQMIETLTKLEFSLELDLLHTIFLISVEKKNDRIIMLIRHWLKLLKQNKYVARKGGDELLSNIGKLILRAVPEAVLSDEKFQETLNDSLVLISENKFPEDIYAALYDEKVKLETNLSEKLKAENDVGKDRDFFDKDNSTIAIQNAGLVILHPFLKHFFSLVKISNNLGNIVPAKRELAVQTLHFLATGSEEFFEGNLVFEKFLCGMPLNMPVPKQSQLTKKIKNEANEMLSEVIKNWPALKNTSPDGLRQMFLQRDGKLIQNNKDFKLIIERKTQDILIEKLAWNISIIKLPWLSEMVFVDW